MNLKLIVGLVAVSVVSMVLWGKWQYHKAWDEGRQALVAEQKLKSEKRLAEQIKRQKEDDSRAAQADQKGRDEASVITREVTKYIATPGRGVCHFDSERVEIKKHAADNANRIEGYDD